MLPRRVPTAWFMIATIPANEGEEAEVPPTPIPISVPPVGAQSPPRTSSSRRTGDEVAWRLSRSGQRDVWQLPHRPASDVNGSDPTGVHVVMPLWYAGRKNTALIPPPPAPTPVHAVRVVELVPDRLESGG